MAVMMPNYDKPWRCPDWSGPRWKGGTGDCPGGSTARWWGEPGAEWRVHTCPECGTRILPYALRLLDPSYYWGLKWWQVRLRARRTWKRLERRWR